MAGSENVQIQEAFLISPQLHLHNDSDPEFTDVEVDLEVEFDDSSEEEFIDLLDEDHSFEIPAGSWNSMTIEADELFISGDIDIDGTLREFDLVLLLDIPLNGQQKFFNIRENVSPQNWNTKLANEDILLPIIEEEAEDEDIDQILENLEELTSTRSGFTHDANGDGEIEEEERAKPVAYTEEMADEVAEQKLLDGNRKRYNRSF